jgi:hypothetical protein
MKRSRLTLLTASSVIALGLMVAPAVVTWNGLHLAANIAHATDAASDGGSAGASGSTGGSATAGGAGGLGGQWFRRDRCRRLGRRQRHRLRCEQLCQQRRLRSGGNRWRIVAAGTPEGQGKAASSGQRRLDGCVSLCLQHGNRDSRRR